MKAAILYVPVLHQGYVKFLSECGEIDAVLVLGRTVTRDRRPFQKDVRALDPLDAVKALRAVARWPVNLVESGYIRDNLSTSYDRIVMPDEDVCRDLAPQLQSQGIEVELKPFFLRWNFSNVDSPPESLPSVADVPETLRLAVESAQREARLSHDQYRHVGAALFSEGEVLLATHGQVPGGWEYLYAEGDPRSLFTKGNRLDASLSMHAEAGLIAQAARQGLATEGKSLYVTTFPCPPCAKIVAVSGVSRVFFTEGYGVLDGDRLMREAGIEVARVQME
jgi:dCMP deaminase